MSLTTHRNTLYNLLPLWARNWNLFRVLYAILVVTDALGDALLAAVKIRFQGLYSNESLPRLSSERKLYQGPNETPGAFGVRLGTWWDVSKHAGNFLTMAQQLQAYCLPDTYLVEIVSNNGTRYTLGTDGSWTVVQTSWNWDGDSSQWSRFWVLLSGGLSVTGSAQTVENDSATVGQPTPWVGSTTSRDVGSDTPYLNYTTSPLPDHQELQRIMEVQRDPHTFCAGMLFLLNHDAFWSSPPAGNWDRWANRSQDCLFWEGTPS